MKATSSKILLTILAALLFLLSALIVSFKSYGADAGAGNNDSIVVQKKIANRNHKVALYPDALHKALFFSVKGESGKVYQLYLFDLDGKLLTQREVRNRQTTFISDFEKGIYLFDVFCDDEKIGNGEILIK
jgi:hypothetical protein